MSSESLLSAEQLTASLKWHLEEWFDVERLRIFIATRDAQQIVEDGDFSDIYDILMWGFSEDPYAKWSKEQLIEVLCEQYPSFSDFEKEYKRVV